VPPFRSAISRRELLGAAVAAGGVLLSATDGRSVDPAATFNEPARPLPLQADADVIVCGGGPAGFAAALTAARSGARTRLFEVCGCLGGVWTAGLLTYIFDFRKPGLPKELVARLDARGARNSRNTDRFVYDPEEMKLLTEEMTVAAGVKTQLHTRVAAAYRDGRRLTTIVTESKSGRQAWRAPVFIDATGDGDLGFQAGCGFEIGRQNDCPCQPLTLNALAVVGDVAPLRDCISFYDNDDSWHVKATQNLLAEIRRAGLDPSYAMPTLFHIRDNLLLVMVNHEYNVRADDAAARSDATIRARAEVARIVDGLRGLGGRWAGLRMVASAEHIGVRDGRRIQGRYTVVRDDLVQGVRQEDAVTRASFGVDIHAADREANRKETISHGNLRTLPYDIPLRALIARDVDGLMLAGRCISGDFIAHASYRVTGNAVAMGEAAGLVAALAVQSQRAPHQVPWAEIAPRLDALRKTPG